MKKRFLFLIAALLVLAALCAACSGGAPSGELPGGDPSGPQNTDPPSDPGLSNFEGVVFEGLTVTYDGQEHTLTVTGAPNGATVAYTQNSATNAGTYGATAVLTKEGYNQKTLTATLQINKAVIDLSGLTFPGGTYAYNGAERAVTVAGTVPDTVTVTYENDKGTNAGTYNATATFAPKDAANYTVSVSSLTATLQIDRAVITTAVFNGAEFPFDGEAHSVSVTGNPAGTAVVYTSDKNGVTNSASAIGTYNITATISGPNYITLELQAALKIKFDVAAVLNMLAALLDDPIPDVWGFVPEKMRPGAALIAGGDAIDYSDFVNIPSLPSGGYGEQWNMVLENLAQTQIFLTSLNVVNTLSGAVTTGYTAFLDNNEADAPYVSESGSYKFQVVYGADGISLTIEYALSGFTAQAYIDYNPATGERNGRVQLSDANALAYTASETELTLALRYGGVRRAYFNIEKESANLTRGELYEYIGLDDVFTSGSAAQFYITPDYVSAVGNKAGAVLGFTGYINELYATATGALLGYEVQETVSVLTYNTLWFNAKDITGWTNVKEGGDGKIYVNNSAAAFVNKKVGGLTLKRESRRYDVEFRTLYFYYMNGDTLEKVGLKIPMMFVQQENLATFAADVTGENPALAFAVGLSSAYQNKITSDYAAYIPVFIAAKDAVTVQIILEYVGEKKTIVG